MKAVPPLLSFLLALATALPAALGENPPPADPDRESSEDSWKAPKDRPDYRIASDEWFREMEALAKTRPAFAPGTGIGDGGGGFFAHVVIEPVNKASGTAYEISISYSSNGLRREQGRPVWTIKRFDLTERITTPELIVRRRLGLFTSATVLDKLVREVVRQSHEIRVPPVEKLPDGRWHIENTTCNEYVVANKSLYLKLQELATKAIEPGEPAPALALASLVVHEAQLAPASRKEGTAEAYQVSIHRHGRMFVTRVSENGTQIAIRPIGWIDAPDLRSELQGMIERRSQD